MYTTYDILDDVLTMRDWVDRFFEDMPSARRYVEYPNINFYEKEDELLINVIAPGLKREDINLELADNSLLIEVIKKEDYENKHYIRKERDFGKFKKAVRLPYRVNNEKIEAAMKDGVLTIRLQKAEDAKPKKILIN